MKRIVICCDGTWKRLDGLRPTNVARIAQAILPRAPDGTEQLVCYLDGVGSGEGAGAVSRLLNRSLGGMFGAGLMQNVAAAYRFLVFNHAPGDEILLFGFSRGAFTARTLAGLMRNSGIVSRSHASMIPHAIALYQGREADSHPDSVAACEFRARYAPDLTTSSAEARWRAETGAAPGAPLTLRYLGVWDTVGALGIPQHLPLAALVNRDFRFHDLQLSSSVLSARQAVAIDELRRTFTPALWSNFAALNRLAGMDRYAQVWFPGDHGEVGGGGATRLLSNFPLVWVAEGARAAGLAIEPAVFSTWRRERDCRAPLATPAPGLVARLLQRNAASRDGPEQMREVSAAAVARWQSDPVYRPAALSRVAAAITRRKEA